MAQLKTGTTIGGRDIVQEFDSHKNDNTLHITSTERNTWNAKETPTGAQAKADTAESNAKSYTDQEVGAVADDLASHKNDKVAHIDYAVASGTNTYTANIQGITALVEGLSVKIKFQNANTGASTLNINGLGAKQIRKSNGNALSAGNIKAGQICHLVYNGVNFQLLGEGGEYGTAQPEHVLEGYTIGTDEGLKEGTMANKGSLSVTPGSSSKSYEAGYYSSIYVAGDSNLKSENIKSGKTIFGVSGKSSVVDTEDATATASDILSGKTAYVNGSKLTGTMPNQGMKIITPGTTNIAIPQGYHDGTGYVVGDSDLKASNIRKGVNIFGVVGTYTEKTLVGEQSTVTFWRNPGGGSGREFLYITNIPFVPHFIYAFESSGSGHSFFIACDGKIGSLLKFQIRYNAINNCYDSATRIGSFVEEDNTWYYNGSRVYIGFGNDYIALFAGASYFYYIIAG